MRGEVANDACYHRNDTLKWMVLLTGHFWWADGMQRSLARPLLSLPLSKNTYYPFSSPHSSTLSTHISTSAVDLRLEDSSRFLFVRSGNRNILETSFIL